MPRPDTGTRSKLISTAKDLIWTSSYGAVSVDDICKAANVKKGSFYHYFPSKQDLAFAAMEEHFDKNVKGVVLPILKSDQPFLNKIEQFADAVLADKRASLKEYGRVCGCPIAALGSEMIGQEEQAIVVRVEEYFGKFYTFFTGPIEQAMNNKEIPHGNPAEKAQEMMDFMTGLMLVSRIHNSLDGLERDLKPGLKRILGIEEKTFEPVTA